MDQLIAVLEALGVYFAIVLVLAGAVESLLDLVKLDGWLRSRISPEQAMKSVAEWIPADATGGASTLLPSAAQEYLASPLARLGGMALTGLAASAGSSFWHDRLDQVRALKEAARR